MVNPNSMWLALLSGLCPNVTSSESVTIPSNKGRPSSWSPFLSFMLFRALDDHCACLPLMNIGSGGGNFVLFKALFLVSTWCTKTVTSITDNLPAGGHPRSCPTQDHTHEDTWNIFLMRLPNPIWPCSFVVPQSPIPAWGEIQKLCRRISQVFHDTLTSGRAAPHPLAHPGAGPLGFRLRRRLLMCAYFRPPHHGRQALLLSLGQCDDYPINLPTQAFRSCHLVLTGNGASYYEHQNAYNRGPGKFQSMLCVCKRRGCRRHSTESCLTVLTDVDSHVNTAEAWGKPGQSRNNWLSQKQLPHCVVT